LAGTENDMLPNGVRPGHDRICGLGRFRIRVDADMAEVVPEARLEERARRPI
jgi:hypothetical protein